MKLWNVLLAVALTVGAIADADAARRLGGGGSVGRQSPNVTQRQATPDAPASPRQYNPAKVGNVASALVPAPS